MSSACYTCGEEGHFLHKAVFVTDLAPFYAHIRSLGAWMPKQGCQYTGKQSCSWLSIQRVHHIWPAHCCKGFLQWGQDQVHKSASNSIIYQFHTDSAPTWVTCPLITWWNRFWTYMVAAISPLPTCLMWHAQVQIALPCFATTNFALHTRIVMVIPLACVPR